jgi:hypothetical protein
MTARFASARKVLTSIGQLISALDDRNLLQALRVLEPGRVGAEDQHDGPRCVRCATRGE